MGWPSAFSARRSAASLGLLYLPVALGIVVVAYVLLASCR